MAPKFMALFLMLDLALFAFVLTKAATCPALDVCARLPGSLNMAFGSQSNSQCCSLLKRIGSVTNAATCLCSTIRSSLLVPNVPPVIGGVLGGGTGTSTVSPSLANSGGIIGSFPTLGSIVNLIPFLGGALVVPILGPIIGGGSTSASTTTNALSQQFTTIFNGCGLNSPAPFTCA